MAEVVAHITHYRCTLGYPNHPLLTASIECDTAEGHLINIGFVAVGTQLLLQVTRPLYPDYPEYAGRFTALLTASEDRFAWYLDLLRNESVVAVLDTNTGATNRLESGWSANAWGQNFT